MRVLLSQQPCKKETRMKQALSPHTLRIHYSAFASNTKKAPTLSVVALIEVKSGFACFTFDVEQGPQQAVYPSAQQRPHGQIPKAGKAQKMFKL